MQEENLLKVEFKNNPNYHLRLVGRILISRLASKYGHRLLVMALIALHNVGTSHLPLILSEEAAYNNMVSNLKESAAFIVSQMTDYDNRAEHEKWEHFRPFLMGEDMVTFTTREALVLTNKAEYGTVRIFSAGTEHPPRRTHCMPEQWPTIQTGGGSSARADRGQSASKGKSKQPGSPAIDLGEKVRG